MKHLAGFGFAIVGLLSVGWLVEVVAPAQEARQNRIFAYLATLE